MKFLIALHNRSDDFTILHVAQLYENIFLDMFSRRQLHQR